MEGDMHTRVSCRGHATEGCGGLRDTCVCVIAYAESGDGPCVFLKPLGPIPRSSVRLSPHLGHSRGLYWHPDHPAIYTRRRGHLHSNKESVFRLLFNQNRRPASGGSRI